jgi:D-alanyl-D-alanine carboxypeptidase
LSDIILKEFMNSSVKFVSGAGNSRNVSRRWDLAFQTFSLSLLLLCFLVPNSFSQTAAAHSKTELAMSREMASVYKPDIPGAAVIVVKNNRVIFRRGYGLANLELKTPIKPEMVFRLASVTKQFTAVAVMMLVERGRLSLDDDLTKFFPDFQTGGKKITIENLLTHTSGIKDYLDKLWTERMREDFRPQKLIELVKNDGLEFEPGTKEAYSNTNYTLLGLIIEQLSGKSYGQFIEDNIFKPLGMKHSYFEELQEIIPNRVSGYARVKEGFVNAAYFSVTQMYAAGGVCSSVDDLALWDAAVNSDKLLKASSIKRIFTPYKLKNGETSAYGYGWAVSQLQGRPIASHTGGVPGFTTYVLHMPEDHLYVAILSNDRTAEVQPEYVAQRIAAIAIGKPLKTVKTIQLAPKILEKYVGKYQGSGDDGNFVIRREGNRLFAQSTGDPEFELFPISETTFMAKVFDARFSFARDAQGKITELIVQIAGQSPHFKKIL